MTDLADSERGQSVVARWRILAARRLDHLVDLYESGRWKLYHEEAEFLTMVQEARSVLATWEALAPPDSAKDKTAEIAVAQDADEASDGVSTDSVAPEHDLRES